MKIVVIFIFLIVLVNIVGIFISSVFRNKKAIINNNIKKEVYKRIDQFTDGETAKITGVIEYVGETLIAPLSGKECAYYYVRVEKSELAGKQRRLTTILEENATKTFVIRDGDKYAFINDKNIKSFIVRDIDYTSGILVDIPKLFEAYLKKNNEKGNGFLGLNRTLRFQEGLLKKGDEVIVSGQGKWLSAIEAGLPDHYGNVLVITGGNEPVYLSNDMGIVNSNKDVF